ncbi:Uncharacterised protein [Bordetella pertussis]|nr:Uncharacterised protein [Bordetella pertussis]CFM04550.1 Uncharacterised protein [Bordetella pertussis]CFM25795.1 Uncharacterised protein [Bordetella pertussis]CFM39141.1 Uncharacterised protein [Bordetella pertussis]CFM51064.1 Uncharacterised protein [Bordetella pertussis]
MAVSAAASTSTPAASVNKNNSCTALTTSSSTVCNCPRIAPTSNTVRLGKACTRSRSTAALAGGRWNEVIQLCGASASACGERMAKKFTRIESQSTRRVPLTTTSTCCPAMSNPSLSPTASFSERASPDSSDTSAASGRSQRPCSTRFDSGSVSP